MVLGQRTSPQLLFSAPFPLSRFLCPELDLGQAAVLKVYANLDHHGWSLSWAELDS